ncbi:hypothetical protein [Natronococcus sp.]|uniref:hypothetical protein n=1 Tax=Natronococcus sp. TaxID=35747 RepID=UPI0025EC8A02|nr:hypothetical protein [Natronococcus sp.]
MPVAVTVDDREPPAAIGSGRAHDDVAETAVADLFEAIEAQRTRTIHAAVRGTDR